MLTPITSRTNISIEVNKTDITNPLLFNIKSNVVVFISINSSQILTSTINYAHVIHRQIINIDS